MHLAFFRHKGVLYDDTFTRPFFDPRSRACGLSAERGLSICARPDIRQPRERLAAHRTRHERRRYRPSGFDPHGRVQDIKIILEAYRPGGVKLEA